MTTGVSQWMLGAPSTILALLGAFMLVRLALELVAANKRTGFAGRLLHTVTDPVFIPVRAITPHIVPAPLVCLVAVCWLVAARMGWMFVAAALGLRTSFGS